MVRDSLGTWCLWGIPDDFAVLRLQNLLIVEPLGVLIQPPQHKNKTPRWGALFFWRMVRDSNPRMGCPINGFQDRRIRPLCQPS